MQNDQEADQIIADALKKCRVPSKTVSAIICILLLVAAYPITLLLGLDDFSDYLLVASALIVIYVVIYLFLGRCAQREAERRLLKRGLDRIKK